MARVSVECRTGEVAKTCIFTMVAKCVYMWWFTIDSCMSFIHSAPCTLPPKHNARRRPPRPAPVHRIERSRTSCRSDGDDDHWNRMRLAPYTRDHGGQWSYIESPCEGNKQTRNMNNDDTQSIWQRCQLNVESVRWRRGALVWWFTIDSSMFFSHLTPRTLSLKHNARGWPPRSSSVQLIKRPRTACRSDVDNDHWNRMRLAPYTRDHGGQWSYVESPCEGNKQTRNMNDDDIQSTWEGCQLNVESMRWRRGAFSP